MTISDDINSLKNDFFRFRNGVIASNLRNHGDRHQYIMGCMLPDITSIASKYQAGEDLANTLWSQSDHRECRLAAAMLFPVESLDYKTALKWCLEIKTNEEADVLCHRLLRKFKGSKTLWRELIDNKASLVQYTGLRLLSNLIAIEKESLTDEVREIINTYVIKAPKYLSEMANGILTDD